MRLDRYLRRSLQKLPDNNVREEDFLKIVMNPDVDLTLSIRDGKYVMDILLILGFSPYLILINKDL